MKNKDIKEQVADGNGAQPKHTPGPWHAFAFELYDERDQIIADCGYSEDVFTKDGCKANAKRIVECVNAMEGIENPQNLRETWDAIQHLELDAYVSMKAQRDDLLDVLKEVEKHHKSQNSEIGNKLRKVIEIVDLTKEIEEGGDGE